MPLSVESLSFARNGRVLLKDVEFTLEAGRISVLLGPNGAGKSLLLRLLMGLIEPDSGSIQWNGKCNGEWGGQPNGQAHDNLRPALGMVLQKPVMLRRSVLANVEFALARIGMAGVARREAAEKALKQAGLLALARQPATRLSGGEARRLAIVRAWSQQPRVLLLDEPCANLDPHSTARVEELIQHIHSGHTRVILSTHDLGQARRLAEEVLFMADGRLLEHAPADTFFDRPASTQARDFLNGRLVL